MRRLLLATLALCLSSTSLVSSSGRSLATPGVDDYPSELRTAARDSVIDPWQFYNRECTSFVAWRLNNDNRFAFKAGMGGAHGTPEWYGNADVWDDAARANGVPVNSTPAVGAVAQWDSMHVAWVKAVNADGSIDVEEYNYGFTGDYNARTITPSGDWPDNFIHFKDLSRTDKIWVHALKGTGVAHYKHTGADVTGWGGFTQLSGRWSSLSSAVDTDGRTWLVGVKTDGTIRYRHTAPSGKGPWTDYRSIGGGGWRSVSTTVDASGRVWVHALKKTGVAFVKHTGKDEKDWGGFTQLSGRWSALSSAVDSRGRVWMVGVKSDGTIRYRYTVKDGWGGWTDYRSIGGGGWTSVSTTVDRSGRVWVHALKKTGIAFVKHTGKDEKDWGGFTQLSGRWSALSSAVDSRGRVWMVGVKSDGAIRYRYTVKDGWGGWTDYRSIGGGGWTSVSTAGS